MSKIPVEIKTIARKLRNNMTDGEIILWSYLQDKKLGVRFMRQKPIHVYTEDNGFDRFIIADFYCKISKLIIELDGSIHNKQEIWELDGYKQNLLEHQGYSILRIKNGTIFSHIGDAINDIKQKL